MTNTAELITVGANTVTIEDNIRTDVVLEDSFIQSITDHGIIQPVLGYRDGDQVIIRAGQRRTLAARQTGQPLTVVITDRNTDITDRVVEQLLENDERRDLTQGERAAAWLQLEVDGLSPTKIAQRIGRKRDEVKAALIVAKNDTIADAVKESTADFLHLAALTEFEEHPDLVATLLHKAENDPGLFDNALNTAKRDAAKRAIRAERVALIEAEGKTAIIDTPGELAKPISQLEKLEGFERAEGVEGDGIVFYVHVPYWSDEAQVVEYVTDPAAYGYRDKSGKTKGMTDEERLARRRVIANNKAWLPATDTRLEWLRTFLNRKGGFPADAAAFMAIALTRHAYEIRDFKQSLAADLLGVKGGYSYGSSALADMVEDQPSKAGLVTFALILATCESETSQNSWRSPSKLNRHYFEQLRTWGYVLSPTELLVLGEGDGAPIPALKHEMQDEDDLPEVEAA